MLQWEQNLLGLCTYKQLNIWHWSVVTFAGLNSKIFMYFINIPPISDQQFNQSHQILYITWSSNYTPLYKPHSRAFFLPLYLKRNFYFFNICNFTIKSSYNIIKYRLWIWIYKNNPRRELNSLYRYYPRATLTKYNIRYNANKK